MGDSERPFDLSQYDRRSFVRLTGVAGVAGAGGLAGCMGDGEGDETDGEEDGEEHEEELPEGVNQTVFDQGPVPAAYRGATSQANEERMPEDQLVTKASVNFMEASDAVEEGLAPEGEACSNCAEYITDKNGDGFGACAKVQGYIGTEDWCDIWESIEEALEEQEGEAHNGSMDDGSTNESTS
jgi:hypothetical protein